MKDTDLLPSGWGGGGSRGSSRGSRDGSLCGGALRGARFRCGQGISNLGGDARRLSLGSRYFASLRQHRRCQ